MGLAILNSRAQIGVEAPPVTIEVFLSGGLPKFNVVGLAETYRQLGLESNAKEYYERAEQMWRPLLDS